MRSKRRAESTASRKEWNRYHRRQTVAIMLGSVIGFFGLGILAVIAMLFSTEPNESSGTPLFLGLVLFYGFLAGASLYSLHQWVKRSDPENPKPRTSVGEDLRRLFAVAKTAAARHTARSTPTRPANTQRPTVRGAATGAARLVFETALERPAIDRELDIPRVTSSRARKLLRAAVSEVHDGGGLGIDVTYASKDALSTVVPMAVDFLVSGRLRAAVLLGVGVQHLSTVQQALNSTIGTATWCRDDELALSAQT